MTAPFARRPLLLAAILGVISLAAGFAAVIFGAHGGVVSSAGPDSFSRSALGHAALVQLLERDGYRVIRSRSRSAAKAGDQALLVLLEPGSGGRAPTETRDVVAAVDRMVGRVRRCLVALPKRQGTEDRAHRGWVQSVDRVSRERAGAVLHAAGVTGLVVRPDAVATWDSRVGITPTLTQPQLVARSNGLSWIGSDEGDLLVEIRDDGEEEARRWVLTDPDVMANHGLDDGDNAALVLAMFEAIAPRGTPIVVDETLHGFVVPVDLWGELGRFPLILVLVQALVLLATLVWAGSVRFGAPLADTFGLAPGKTVLLENIAGLLLRGGHAAAVLRRYHVHCERQVAGMLHLPPDLSAGERSGRLQHLSEVRGTTLTPIELQKLVAKATEPGDRGGESAVLAAAREIQRWRKEIVDGHRRAAAAS